MDNTLVWMLIFAAAVIGLLAVFLVASEKELKKKRAELSELTDEAAKSVASTGNEGAEVMGLRAKNQDLQRRLASLEDDLAESHRAIDELRAGQKRGAGAETELHHLRSANEQLKADLAKLAAQPQATELMTVADPAQAEEIASLKAQLTDVTNQLQSTQARLQAPQHASAPQVDVTAIEASHRAATQKLESKIAELEAALANSTERAHELEASRQKLADAGRAQDHLRTSVKELENEVSQLRARAAEAGEHQKRLLSLQPAYNQLMTKQAALANIHRDFRDELNSFAKMMSAAADFSNGGAVTAAIKSAPLAMPSSIGVAEDDALPVVAAAAAAQDDKPRRRFSIFHGIIFVAGLGLSGALLLRGANDPTPVAVAKPNPAAATKAPTPKPVPVVAATTTEPVQAPASTKTVEPTAKPAKAAAEVAKALPPAAAKAETPAATYQITQATKVFAAPSDQAQQVGEIDAGLNVAVVNNRGDGWLEIRSKHGRPPGYIRREAAARIAR